MIQMINQISRDKSARLLRFLGSSHEDQIPGYPTSCDLKVWILIIIIESYEWTSVNGSLLLTRCQLVDVLSD